MIQRSYLLVDDNPEFLENLAEILLGTEAQVCTAASGTEALEEARKRRFDAIVTDMRMPGMSGAEFVHQLRAFDTEVPVILLSAYAADVQLRDARRDGLLAVLSKPSQIPRLLELLGKARRGGTIVIVEDDVALAENLTEALNAHGLTVCTAGDLQEIEKIGVTPFAALVDLRVPGGPSGEGVSRVRARFPGARTVVITAYAHEAREYDALFTKPFKTPELLERLEAMYAEQGPQ